MGTQLPPPPLKKSGHNNPLIFSLCIVAKQLNGSNATWYGGSPWPWPHFVRWGPNYPHQTGHSPKFLAHVCCSQTAGWMRMPLGTEVGLGPGDIVLDGDPAHSRLTHSFLLYGGGPPNLSILWNSTYSETHISGMFQLAGYS